MITLILIIITAALHLFFLTRDEHMGFAHALRKGAGSVVVFLMSIAVIWPVAALLSYHMRVSSDSLSFSGHNFEEDMCYFNACPYAPNLTARPLLRPSLFLSFLSEYHY